MKLTITKSTRIFLYFFLGIGLPCVLLSYFAFRGIQNDLALTEKQISAEHRKLAERIRESLDERVHEVEQSCIQSLPVPGQQVSSVIKSVNLLKNQNSAIEEIFLLDSLQNIRLPAAHLLYLPDKKNSLYPSNPFVASDLVKRGQRFEFQQQAYKKALATYQKAFAESRSRQAQAGLLIATARVQNKLSRFDEAIASYQTLCQQYRDVQDTHGCPYGLAAYVELASLNLSSKDSLKAIQSFLSTYENLLQDVWRLEKSQYDFYANRLRNYLKSIVASAAIPSYQNTLRDLNETAIKRRLLTERLLTFQREAGKALFEHRLKEKDGLNERDSSVRLTIEAGGHEFLISLLRDGFGILWQPDYLKATFLPAIVREHLSSENIYWQTVNRDGNVVLKSQNSPRSKLTVKTFFMDNFPPWSLEFYQQDRSTFETILTSRRNVYFYIFVLIAGILIFGLTLTIRSVTHELELAKMKDDFVSAVSHEFRSPLTSIRQLAEMLQSRRVPSEERRQKYYDVIVEQSERLSLMINNILDFSRMEEGKKHFNFEWTDMSALLNDVASIIQHRVQHEGFDIQAEIGNTLPAIKVDRIAITQAIENLVDNAIKYSDCVKKVSIKSSVDSQHLHISVRDFGIGMKREEMAKVFDRFYRCRNELTRTTRGSGLGLTVVQQIVRAHRGVVDVESEPGKGSRFTIRLPIHS